MVSSPAALPAATALRFSRTFSWRVGWRLLLLALAMAACAWAAAPPALPATATLAALLALWLGHELWREVQRTNLELSRLMQALRHHDHSARFDGHTGSPTDAGFAELAQALHELLERQREQSLAERSRHAQVLAVLDHVPTPLVAVDAEARVSLLNRAARRLLGARSGQQAAAFAVFGPDLPAALCASTAAEQAAWQQLELRPADDAAVRLRVARSETLFDGRPQRLLALQPIQAELDQAESRLAADLVRVLTHEVMNSLTPVNSLLRSAADAAGQLGDAPGVQPLRAALATAVRRSEGLMQFAQRYQVLAQPLLPEKAPLAAAALLASLAALFRAEWPPSQVVLELVPPAEALTMTVDRDLIEPMLLNLLRNAAQAAVAHQERACVRLSLQRAGSGRTLIDIEDNGPGIALQLREEVFLPFFTTKPDGHGVGLSLARQTVLAHGGAIRIEASGSLGGALVRIAL